MANYNVYLVGVGGQGILTIADMIMRAAQELNVPANYYPTKGMAQRGGFVKAQLKLGAETVGPDIRPLGADLGVRRIIKKTLKAIRYIKPGGTLVVYGYKWQPTAVMLGKAPYPTREDVEKAAADAQLKLVFLDPADQPEDTADNIYLLAATMRHSGLGDVVSEEAITDAIKARWPKGAERNMRSFEAGLAVE